MLTWAAAGNPRGRAGQSAVLLPETPDIGHGQPADSVVDQFGKTWEVDNLVITDGSVFTSNAHKNPTLTIMALAWRAADNLAERMRRGEV